MNIGDRVRLLHDAQEGIIIRFVNERIVEIEIEDGFRLSVGKSELVPISKDENKFFATTKGKETKSTKTEIIAESGIFLAFVHTTDKMLDLHIINNTDLDLLFTMGEERPENYLGVYSALLPARKAIRIHELNIDKFEKWYPLIFQYMVHRNGLSRYKEPIVRKYIFKSSLFFKSKKEAPLLGKDAYLFQVDDPAQAPPKKYTPEEIRQEMLGNTKATVAPEVVVKVEKPPIEVDLHIETLTNTHKNMTSSEIIDLQLRTFEHSLDKAIAANMEQIIFIHGVGNGVLKAEIHKRLSKNSYIKFFQEAKKEKFGFGATLVRLK